MKNILKFLLIAFFGVLLVSCEKDEDKAVLGTTANGSLTADVSSVVLSQSTLSAPAIKFTWVDPTFTVNLAEGKFLEFGKKTTNFTPSVTFTLPVNVNTVTLTHEQLNSLMSQLGLTPGQLSQVQVRLKSTVGTYNYYSQPIDLSVTPFIPNPDLIYPKINVPGKYGGLSGYDEWNPSNTFNLYSPSSNNQYRGFVFVNNYTNADDYQYKFTINQGWTGDKGDDNTFTGKLVETGETNCKFPFGGTYYIKVDWTGNTYSTSVANLGIIGDATPTSWNSDTDFTYNPATKNWEIASINLQSTGIFKFRANDDWAMKFQPASTDQTLASGTAVQTFLSSEGTVTNDPSYKVSVTGNYKVVLDLHNAAYYKLTVTKL